MKLFYSKKKYIYIYENFYHLSYFTHQSFLFAGQPEQHPNIVKERRMPNQNHIHATIPDMTVGTESHRASGTATREIGTIYHEEFASDSHPS